MKISLDKKYKTRDGKEVRIYALDAGGHYPVHGAIKVYDNWENESWTDAGLFKIDNTQTPFGKDLIEVKEKRKLYAWRRHSEAPVEFHPEGQQMIMYEGKHGIPKRMPEYDIEFEDD